MASFGGKADPAKIARGIKALCLSAAEPSRAASGQIVKKSENFFRENSKRWGRVTHSGPRDVAGWVDGRRVTASLLRVCSMVVSV